MPLYLDFHKGMEGLTAQAAREAHAQDLKTQEKYGVKYLKYWYSEKDGAVFCLVDAPDKEAARAVHREAHGLMPEDIIEVEEGS